MAKKSSLERVPSKDAGTTETSKVRKTILISDTNAVKDRRVETEKEEPPDDDRASTNESVHRSKPRHTSYAVPGSYDERLLSTPMPQAQVGPHLPVDANPTHTPQDQQRTNVGLCSAMDSERTTRLTPGTTDSAIAYASTSQCYLFDLRTPNYQSSFRSSFVLDEGGLSTLSFPLSFASHPKDDDGEKIGNIAEYPNLDPYSEWHEQDQPVHPTPTTYPTLPLRYPPPMKPHFSNLLNPE